MDFASRIKELCKLKGINLSVLSKRLGITSVGLSKSINQPYPQLQTLERIARALDVEVCDLFERRSDFVALVRHEGKTYAFASPSELKTFIDALLYPDGAQISKQTSEVYP